MISDEARALKVGDTVIWEDDLSDQGTVIITNGTSLSVKWHYSGMIGVYRYDSPAINYINRIKKEGQNAQPSFS